MCPRGHSRQPRVGVFPGSRRWTIFCMGVRRAAPRYNAVVMSTRLPPTSPSLMEDSHRPYFLWWTDVTAGQLRQFLRSPDIDERVYWMGALLREANTRDVWSFVSPREILDLWPRLLRHLGRSRAMWGYLLGLDATWPPPEARIA